MNIDKDIKILEKKKKALDLHIDNYYKNDCETAICRELVKERNAIENVLADRETWKKIAEKLAEKLSIAVQGDYAYEKVCFDNVNYVDCGNRRIAYKCKQCILEYARKEVEKNGNN